MDQEIIQALTDLSPPLIIAIKPFTPAVRNKFDELIDREPISLYE